MKETLDEILSELLGYGDKEPSTVPPSPRERIVQAALELFAAHSYEGATTKAIAARAGVTERTLFKHFPSKEDLFARTVFPALVQAIAPISIQPMLPLLQTHADNFEATVRTLVAERVAFAVQHPSIVAMVVREGLLRPAFRDTLTVYFTQRMRPTMEAFIDRARASGQIRNLPTEALIRAIMGQLVAYVVARVLLAPEAPWDDEVEVERIVSLIMHGIAASDSDTGTLAPKI